MHRKMMKSHHTLTRRVLLQRSVSAIGLTAAAPLAPDLDTLMDKITLI